MKLLEYGLACASEYQMKILRRSYRRSDIRRHATSWVDIIALHASIRPRHRRCMIFGDRRAATAAAAAAAVDDDDDDDFWSAAADVPVNKILLLPIYWRQPSDRAKQYKDLVWLGQHDGDLRHRAGIQCDQGMYNYWHWPLCLRSAWPTQQSYRNLKGSRCSDHYLHG